MVTTIAREKVTKLAARQGEPKWLTERRQAYWTKSIEQSEPVKKQDDWRKTLIETLELELAQPVGTTKTDQNVLKEAWLKKLVAYMPAVSAVVTDGKEGAAVELRSDSAKGLSEKGLVVSTIQEATTKHQELLKKYLPEGSVYSQDKLGAMAEAFFANGAFIYIPKNTKLDGPILIANSVKSDGDSTPVFTRVLIAVEDGAEVEIINVFASTDSEKSDFKIPKKGKAEWQLSNALVEIVQGQASHVRYIELQSFNADVFSVVRNTNDVGKDSSLESLTIGLRGGQLKSDIVTNLRGRGANADIEGIVVGAREEHFSFNTIQNHIEPDTHSNIDFRIALKDKSVSSYQGNIKVEPEAQKIQAFQANKNLILGEDARADSIPRLEILADDVKCSHGATVGPIDKEQVFYLMTRGLSRTEAEELVVQGFFNTVLAACKVAGINEWINSLLSEKLHS